jgi:deoxyribodipyrimidine photolyase-related protein
VHPNDDWLQRRLTTALQKAKIGCTLLNDPHFLTTHEQFAEFAAEKPKLFFTEFYIRQRRRLGILLDQRGQPSGGQWSFDPENRKKLPRSISIPATKKLTRSANFVRTEQEISQQFPQACGNLTSFNYPIDRTEAFACLNDFLDHRFQLFGDYEDAIHSDESVLFHSLLTPALNIGLLSPREVVDAALARADEVPLNSLEGFVRQVIGWREYIRGVYHILGRRQRGGNFWEHTQPIPTAFYTGETGVEPVDVVIRRVLRYAYCHHIERLMILGNFMLLCEINPNEVYRWFMELFIDAYDWVMVPNVYGMSQFADGGTITTKPYISGSSYVRRMSNFRSGSWCEICPHRNVPSRTYVAKP